MQYLLGQPVVLKTKDNRFGIVTSFSSNLLPNVSYIDDDGDIEEEIFVNNEIAVVREPCSEKVSPTKFKVYYGKLCKKYIKLSDKVKLRTTPEELKNTIIGITQLPQFKEKTPKETV